MIMKPLTVFTVGNKELDAEFKAHCLINLKIPVRVIEQFMIRYILVVRNEYRKNSRDPVELIEDSTILEFASMYPLE